jgi:hypothetical protein
VLGGTVTSPQNLIAPSVEKVYIINNQTGNTVTIKTSGGNGAAIPTGSYAQVYCDGTNFFNASPNVNSIDGNLTVTGNIAAGANVTANNASITNNLTAGANITANNVSITNNLAVGGTVTGIPGRIVQTVRASGNSASTSSTGYVPTGHTATITPTSASSKILVLVNAMFWQTNVFFNSANVYMALFRNGSNAQSGDWIMVNANVNGASGASIFAFAAMMYLDSPNSTSALTYQPYIRADGNGACVYNATANGTVTLLEITA